MSDRFIVVGFENLKNYKDPEGYGEVYSSWDNDLEWASYVVDTETDTVVFCDRCEPEDATLDRHFGALLDLANVGR